MRADYFISYSSADQSWAEWIAWQLEGAGLTTVLQIRDFEPGSNFVQEMESAIFQTDRVIAVLSPDYIASAFGAAEWSTALYVGSTAERRRLLPVRVRDCRPDGLLGQISYLDLVNKDENTARVLLLAAVGSDEVRLPEELSHPNGSFTMVSTPPFPIAAPAGDKRVDPAPQPNSPRALIFTALTPEFSAVCAHLKGLGESNFPNAVACKRGRFEGEAYSWEVTVVQVGMGLEAVLLVQQATAQFKPEVALFVGVAAGLKGVQVGDVVIGTEVYSYESSILGGLRRQQISRTRSSELLVAQAAKTASNPDWQRRLRRSTNRTPTVQIGSIVSTDILINSNKLIGPPLLPSNARAIELESSAILATQTDLSVAVLVIRGISDLADGRRDDEGLELGTDSAVAFAFSLLAGLVESDLSRSTISNITARLDMSSATEMENDLVAESKDTRERSQNTSDSNLATDPRTDLGEDDNLMLSVFCAYSHHDEQLMEKLQMHLAPMQRRGWIRVWHDRKIGAGSEWEPEIDKYLETADVILLLISSSFFASDYCYRKEMSRALERHEQRLSLVVPIIARPVDWHGTPIGKLQAVPKDGKPVVSWSNRDTAWTDAVRTIRSMVEELRATDRVREGLGLPTSRAQERTRSATATASEVNRKTRNSEGVYSTVEHTKSAENPATNQVQEVSPVGLEEPLGEGLDSSSLALLRLADLLARQPGREDEAERLLREAIQRGSKQALLSLGILLATQQGREVEAELLLREASRLGL